MGGRPAYGSLADAGQFYLSGAGSSPVPRNARQTIDSAGEPERALQAVELGLRIEPNRAAYKKIKARLFIDAGQALQAAEVLMQRPPAMSADIEYHDMLATALLASQNYSDAVTTYQALLRQNNSIGRWWYGLAVALDTLGRRVEAVDAYQQASRREDLPPALREQSRERLALIRAAQ